MLNYMHIGLLTGLHIFFGFVKSYLGFVQAFQSFHVYAISHHLVNLANVNS